MIAKTKQALNESIAAWKKKARATSPAGVSLSGNECPLCVIFSGAGGCEGCPVKISTGKRLCADTPYRQASHAIALWRDSKDDDDMLAFQQAAQDEVEFLQGLLP